MKKKKPFVKLDIPEFGPNDATPEDIDRYMRSEVEFSIKQLRKQRLPLDAYKGALLERRIKALKATVEQIRARYTFEKSPLSPVKLWIKMNMGVCLPRNRNDHIDYAAAVWILDHAPDREAMYKLLPPTANENTLPEKHMSYSNELIGRVITLMKRGGNMPQELIEQIDKFSAESAAAEFKNMMRQYVDRVFEVLRLKNNAFADVLKRVQSETVEYNKLVDEIDAVKAQIKAEKAERDKHVQKLKRTGAPFAQNPLEIKPEALLNGMDGSNFRLPINDNPLSGLSSSPAERKLEALEDLVLKYVGDQLDNMKALSEWLVTMTDLTFELVDKPIYNVEGVERDELKEPLPISDPYAMCFAYRYLEAQDDDVVWLVGARAGLMENVVDMLPWNIDYGVLEKTKPVQHTDWYTMRSGKDGEVVNLAQIVYDYTHVVIPTRLEGELDGCAPRLRRLGLKKSEVEHIVELIQILDYVDLALFAELDELEYDDMELTQTDDVEELKRQISELKEQNKALRSEVHASERRAQDAHNALNDEREQAQLDRRELADLREYVFNLSSEAEPEPIQESSGIELPYTITKRTVVYGGHESWLRQMKELLKGDIRYIDKDIVTDANIIRNADVIWFQINAISHKQFYPVIDYARRFKVPVKYCSNASARKCAEQIAQADSE